MRTRRNSDDSEDFSGQDSFLDIVANIVGILILLVVVVGVRASQNIVEAAKAKLNDSATAEDGAAIRQQLGQAKHRAIGTQKDVEDLVDRIVNVHNEAVLRDEERVALNTVVLEAEKQIEAERSKLDEQEQQDFDVRRQLSEAQQTLDQLTREQAALLSQAPEIEQLENLPTPLARTVNGDEVHLRLNDGFVAFIPLDELIAELKTDAESNQWQLQDNNIAESMIGPRNGFRLRYRLRQREIVLRSPQGRVQQGTITELVRWQLIPESERMGEPVDQSISASSDLMHFLNDYRPASTTITVWTYPGSFNEFRTLKQALFEMGFSIAGRPLPDGKLIGGSPDGSKSAAQ